MLNMKLRSSWLAALAVLTLAASPLARADEVKKGPIQVDASKGEVTEKGKIEGEQFVDYTFSAEVGQSLSIVLETNSKNCHFDLIAPGSDTPIYKSGITGDRYKANVRAGGEHRARVYLVPRAARKGESASYSIAFKLAAAQ